MAILEHEVRSAAESRITGLHRLTLTRKEYYAIGETGVFGDRRLELIEGEVIEMTPIGHPHAAINHPLAVLLQSCFGSEYTVRNQEPISLGDENKPSEPQPDIAVVAGAWRDYLSKHPGPADIKLIVEIADTSLIADRTIKAALYAAANIPEYWILNLVDRQLEVHRTPTETGYDDISNYGVGETVEPLFAMGKSVAVGEFMP